MKSEEPAEWNGGHLRGQEITGGSKKGKRETGLKGGGIGNFFGGGEIQ